MLFPLKYISKCYKLLGNFFKPSANNFISNSYPILFVDRHNFKHCKLLGSYFNPSPKYF